MKRVVLCTTGKHPVFEAILQSQHQIAAFVDFGKPEHRLSRQRSLYNRVQERVFHRPRTAAAACRLHAIPYVHVRGRELEEASRLVEEAGADVMVVAQAPILPRSFFALLPNRAINLHPSKLPHYRGADPFFWMAVDQVKEAAATVHMLTEQVDQGDILAQKTRPVELGLTAQQLSRIAVKELGVPLVVDVLDRFDDLIKACAPQPTSDATPPKRRVGPNNFHNVVDLKSLSLDQAWNVLRFTQGWPNVIDTSSGSNKIYSWEVLGRDRVVSRINKLSDGNVRIEKRQGRWYYLHPEGDIEIRRRYTLGEFIRSRVA